jgi:hypothetical protein
MKARVLTIMAAGVLGVGSAVALADNGGGDNRSERGQGAPGWVCKKQFTPGSKEFKACVQELAHKRGRGHQTTSTGTSTTSTTGTTSTTSTTASPSHAHGRGHNGR